MEILKKQSRPTNAGILVTYTDGFGTPHPDCWAEVYYNAYFPNEVLRIQVQLYSSFEAYQNDDPVLANIEVKCEQNSIEWGTTFSNGALMTDVLGYVQAVINAGNSNLIRLLTEEEMKKWK